MATTNKFFKVKNGLDVNSNATVDASGNANIAGNLTANTGFVSADAFRVDTTFTTPSSTPGEMVWNDTDGTIEFQLKGGNVTLQLGQEQVLRVRNNTASTITNGTVVYIKNSTGSHFNVEPALASADPTSAQTLGVMSEDITTTGGTQTGYVTTNGLVRNIDLSYISGLTAGDILYLDGTTAGRMTRVKPQAPIHIVYVGYCLSAAGGGVNSIVFVKPQNGYELDEIHDVKITSLATDNILQRTANNLWENKTLASANIANLASTGTQTFFANVVGKSFTTTGVIAANGGNVSTSQFTATLFNENATTVSIAGAATTVNIGATGGTTTFAGNVTAANISTSGIANVGQLDVLSTATFYKPQGSAPFIVASNTTVANLSANLLNGYTISTATPDTIVLRSNIGNFTANTITANLNGTTVNVTGQLISTVATGTAPFSVSSTTQVTNLTAQFVTNGVYTTTTSLPNVTSVNSTTIPNGVTLLTTSNIGGSVQAYDNDLASLANTTSAAGFLYNNGAGTFTYTSIPNSSTTASDANGASTIVARNANGSFAGNVITATKFIGIIDGGSA